MKPNFWHHRGVVTAILLTVYLGLNLTGCGTPILGDTSNYSASEQSTHTQSDTPKTSQVSKDVIRINDLPAEAKETIKLIENGGPFPYSKDGSIFNNYEGLLPDKPARYYHEYTVITPGAPDRGAQRIVAGSSGEYYYTDDHYNTFRLVVE
jgi:ribonuclease T1